MRDLPAPRPSSARHRRRAFGMGAAAVILCGLVAWFGTRIATDYVFEESAARGHNTLGLAVTALRGQLDRYEKLPELIADQDAIRALAANPGDAARVDAANRYLEAINGLLESSDIYVMMPDGTTLAASNYATDTSFIGENFSYRPYFQDAIAGGRGRFFALGTTSLKRGYYFGAPIRDRGAILGVVVFKVDVDAIERAWRGGDYEIVVTDPEGIVFMASRPDWMYAGMRPLTEDRIRRTVATRRYAETALTQLAVTRGDGGAGYELMAIDGANGTSEYLTVTETMPEAAWTVKVMLDTAPARAQALTTVAAALLLILLGFLVLSVWLGRRARLAEHLEAQRGQQEELERRVGARTRDLAAVASRLELEVAERSAAERRLRQTQADLIQAGKLAALGQMSAALSHEFNQPLAATRTYADNAALLIDRGRVQEARDNLDRISRLVERMASISHHLRNFARKPNERLRAVSLDTVISDTLEIVAWRLKAADATLSIDIGPDPIHVRAGSVRLQQVLVNIVTNAADAVEGFEDRRIDLVVRATGERVAIKVRDRGPGVPDAIAQRIFDPFFSTKGVGKGLGLGLSISYNIVKDFGGELSVSRHAEGGAVVEIVLDRAAPALREAAE